MIKTISREWEKRFVMYGFILLQALEAINDNPKDGAKLAKKALDKFNCKVKNLKKGDL